MYIPVRLIGLLVGTAIVSFILAPPHVFFPIAAVLAIGGGIALIGSSPGLGVVLMALGILMGINGIWLNIKRWRREQ